jgi:hypothetical protein
MGVLRRKVRRSSWLPIHLQKGLDASFVTWSTYPVRPTIGVWSGSSTLGTCGIGPQSESSEEWHQKPHKRSRHGLDLATLEARFKPVSSSGSYQKLLLSTLFARVLPV